MLSAHLKSYLVLAMFSGEVRGEMSMTALGWSASDVRALVAAAVSDSSFRMARSWESSLLSRFLVMLDETTNGDKSTRCDYSRRLVESHLVSSIYLSIAISTWPTSSLQSHNDDLYSLVTVTVTVT